MKTLIISLVESTLTHPAKEALNAIGGMRAMTMLGASQIRDLSSGSADGSKKLGVGVKWPNRKRSKGNYFELWVDGSDEYTLDFYSVSTRETKKVKSFKKIPIENIRDAFESHTGWYLSM